MRHPGALLREHLSAPLSSVARLPVGGEGNSGGCSVVDGSGSNVGGALGALLGLALVVRRRRALSLPRG
jgi:MYXO-CTERM domain-containing protein